LSHYKSNLRDIEFNLFELLGQQGALGADRFPDLDEETARSILGEAAKLAAGPLAASYAGTDRDPPAFDPAAGAVRVPAAFRASYEAFMEAGWFRLGLPAELGGTPAPQALVWSVAALVLGANPAIWMYAGGPGIAAILWQLGTPEQRQFAQLAAERQWGATMVLTEPDAGSDVGAGRTRAVPQPDGTWHIEGVKRFISCAEHDLAENIFHLVLARPAGHGPGTKGLSLFLVPKYLVGPDGELGPRNGVRATGLEHKMGLKASATCELTFGGSVPAVGTLVGGVHDGIRQMFKIIEDARMMVGVKAAAILSTGYLNALDFARNRVQGTDLTRITDKGAPGVAIIRHPDVRQMLMQQKAYAEGLRALALYTASLLDAPQAGPATGAPGEVGVPGEAARARAALLLPVVKAAGSERAYEMLALSLQTLGGSGYLRDYPYEQYLRDAKVDSIYEGTTGIQGLDLFFRKIARDRGAAVRALLGDISEFAAADDTADDTADATGEDTGGDTGGASVAVAGVLKAERAALADGVADVAGMLTAMTGFLVGAARRPEQAYQVGLTTTRLLLALGDLVVGWLLTRQAEVAQGRLAGAGGPGGPLSAADRDFYAGKVAAARFFTATVLPRLAADRRVIEATGLDLMDLPDSAL
jgi:alkylation response protein AidB-like acyl-CoA dehydrogenase